MAGHASCHAPPRITPRPVAPRARLHDLCGLPAPWPRPVLQAGSGARILIAGQAPGRKVHASGIPFDDASGQRLRDWLGLTREQVYDPSQVAILPMGLCYPGKGISGDAPPRPECARRGAHSCWRIYRVWPSPWCWVSTRSPGICPRALGRDPGGTKLAAPLARGRRPAPSQPAQQRLAQAQPMVRDAVAARGAGTRDCRACDQRQARSHHLIDIGQPAIDLRQVGMLHHRTAACTCKDLGHGLSAAMD